MNFKSKSVLLCAEISTSSKMIINTFLNQNIKRLIVANPDETFIETLRIDDARISHCKKGITKLPDIQGIYQEALQQTKKKVDIIINHKEITADVVWEDVITSHINSLICSTLMAIKHLGSMNGGRGGIVVNSITMRQCKPEEYASVRQLLHDLDRSFSDPYYFNNTAVRILTMCTHTEIAQVEQEHREGSALDDAKERPFADTINAGVAPTGSGAVTIAVEDANPQGATAASSSGINMKAKAFDNIFLEILAEKQSYFSDEPMKLVAAMEQLEICVDEN